MATEKLVYTVDETAEVLSISRNLAYELIKEGKLPAIRISQKRLVVPRAALEKLLHDGCTAEKLGRR